MLCSKLHCQIFFKLKLFSYKISITPVQKLTCCGNQMCATVNVSDSQSTCVLDKGENLYRTYVGP